MEFPKILVINLADRKDRWKDIQEEFKDWPEGLHRISAVKRKVGWKGCTLSHQKAVQYAKEHDFPWVLILEDDCQLEKDALKRFQELLPILWDRRSDWDIFMGGISTPLSHGRVIQDNPSILKVKGYSSHFCLIHEQIYSKILTMKMTKIDFFYKEKLRLWITIPYLAIQTPGKSDIQLKLEDHTALFLRSERQFCRMLRKWRKTRKRKTRKRKTRKH